MKKILLILLISFSLMSCSESINQNHLHNRNPKFKGYFQNKFKNNQVIAYCKNGKILYKGKFKNGKKNGEWITYYENKKIKSKEIYKDGKKDGESITYNENGKIKYIRNYRDGKVINYDTVSRLK